MLKIYKEIDATDFEEDSWCAEYFWEKLHEQHLEDAFNDYAEDVWPDGCDETTFNDWIRFDGDDILANIGYIENAEDDEDDEDEYEDKDEE